MIYFRCSASSVDFQEKIRDVAPVALSLSEQKQKESEKGPAGSEGCCCRLQASRRECGKLVTAQPGSRGTTTVY